MQEVYSLRFRHGQFHFGGVRFGPLHVGSGTAETLSMVNEFAFC
jgi:hypothetical protein